MQCANELVLRRDNSLTIKPVICFNGVDWENAEFSFMKKATFIWISIFYAFVMNALRHGFLETVDEDNSSRYVNIEIKIEGQYLTITNKYIPHTSSSQRDGITLETVKAFLVHYGFEIVIPEQRDPEGYYIVKIPLKKK